MAPRRISLAQWSAITTFNWTDSSALKQAAGESAASAQAAGFWVADIRVYPALLSPCRADLLSGLLLADALARFVVGDPEVVALSKKALARSPVLDVSRVDGRYAVRNAS